MQQCDEDEPCKFDPPCEDCCCEGPKFRVYKPLDMSEIKKPDGLPVTKENIEIMNKKIPRLSEKESKELFSK